MRILVNTSNLQTGGALQIAENVLQEWASQFPQHEFIVCLSPQLAQRMDTKPFPSQFRFFYFRSNPSSGWINVLFFHRKLNKIVETEKASLAFTFFGPALWKPSVPHLVGFANGYYLYNDSRFIQEQFNNKWYQRLKYNVRRSLLFRQLKREGDLYWVETPTAKNRLAQTIQVNAERIQVIGNTYASSLSSSPTNSDRPNNTFKLLYPSAYYAHKNFEILPHVLRLLSKEDIHYQLVLSLPQEDFERVFLSMKDRTQVKNLGPLKQDDLAKAYEYADALIMPSLLETSSANFPEAMYMAKPILCSKLDFATDICDNAALYFDPYEPEDIASKIIQLSKNPELQEQLVEAGKQRLNTFETATSRAQKLMQCLESLKNNI